MIGLLVAATIASGAPAALSPAAQSLLRSLQAAVDEVRARQAALGPPKDDAERLRRLGELDQAPRKVIVAFDFSRIPPAERQRVIDLESAMFKALDQANEAALLKLIPKDGWFARSLYGDPAASAAFHIVQHADTALQERFLPAIGRFVARGEAPGESYAMMADRVAISHGRPQLFGTQFRCDAGKWRPYPITDIDQIETRRGAVGIRGSYAQMQAALSALPPCPQTQSPAPAGMKLN